MSVDWLALTSTLSSGRGNANEPLHWMDAACRVLSVIRRGERLASDLGRGRAPSPGGEGRGEGGRILNTLAA
jgi:hypothetical protein